MSDDSLSPLPYNSPPEAYAREVDALRAALAAHDREAVLRLKWGHPRFQGVSVAEVSVARTGIDDARTVVAREQGFEDWPELTDYAERVRRDERVRRFEAAVDAVVSGDERAVEATLIDDPGLARARSVRRHHATLLHYVAANGVEQDRQRTPPNAVGIATRLLDAGADPDALADMYGHQCTTLSLLVSSSPPADAGLQLALAELLLDRGARLRGPGSAWQSAVVTALTFGFSDTARALSRRGGLVTDLVEAAGLGEAGQVERSLPESDARARHAALALAAQHGHTGAVRVLLEAGEDTNRFNPDGFHGHATPLHQAAGGDHVDVVRLLVERGAHLDVRDRIYGATPLGWAEHGRCTRTAELLRELGAQR